MLVSFPALLAVSRLVLDFDLLVYAFGQLPLVVSTWLCMFLSVLVVPYGLFHLWAGHYQAPQRRTLRSALAGGAFLLYQGLGLGFLPAYVVMKNCFPPASRFIVILEQVTRTLLQTKLPPYFTIQPLATSELQCSCCCCAAGHIIMSRESGNKDSALSAPGAFDNEGAFLCQGERPEGVGVCARKEQ